MDLEVEGQIGKGDLGTGVDTREEFRMGITRGMDKTIKTLRAEHLRMEMAHKTKVITNQPRINKGETDHPSDAGAGSLERVSSYNNWKPTRTICGRGRTNGDDWRK